MGTLGWFIIVAAMVVDLGWGISNYSDKQDKLSFQAEFGIAYPSTPVQKEIAKAVVAAHLGELYQKQFDSWKRYSALQEKFGAIQDKQTFSVEDAKAKLNLSQEVDQAHAAHQVDFERLGKSCSVLYDDYHQYRNDLHDKYAELSIPRQPDCEYYFSLDSNSR